MKGNLREKEPEIQQFWKNLDIYNRILDKNAGKPAFILHDGPPYANGNIHIGHALNKILKDILVKYKNISGYSAPFVPGWDCHGLPIEYQLFKELNIDKSKISQIEFRKKAAEFAEKFVNIQMKEFMRLGIFADFLHPYFTMQKSYEAEILEIFAKLAEEKYIYRGAKPVYWCPQCGTALAEAEVEYKDAATPSIFILFEAEDEEFKNTYALVWTTTPWTLLANVALAFNKNFLYSTVSVKQNGREIRLIMADEKAEEICQKQGINEFSIISQEKGLKFAGKKFRHPFIKREVVGITADFVEKAEGSGIVHIAPGHGEDDYRAGILYNLPVISPVDDGGKFTEEAEEFRGMFVFDANDKIMQILKNKGLLFKSEEIIHSYPHCWRCKKPIIFRTTPQWFVSVDNLGLRKKMLDEINGTQWFPPEGLKRISAMVELRPDWCISRQRYWGVPIPVFYCAECGKPILDAKIIRKLAALVRAAGSDILLDSENNLPVELVCAACGGKKFRRENDILDVWFDSGASWHILEERAEHRFPADVYLEGSDQHRGWFQTSLILSCAVRGSTPYRNVITHGFVVDGKGQKMSKSQGNVITPQEIIAGSGAEILRIWVAGQDYSADLKISQEILKTCVDSYRKIRNTFRFLLGNLHGWTPDVEVEFSKMTELDRWILVEMEDMKKKVIQDYEKYDFAAAFHKIFLFMNLRLSSLYLDVIKDRLYTLGENWSARRSSQTALWQILKNVAILISPILSHTAEEVWRTINEEIGGRADKSESVFLNDIPKEIFSAGETVKKNWRILLEVRSVVIKAIEISRGKGEIGNALEAGVEITLPEEKRAALSALTEEELKEFFLVSELRKAREDEVVSDFEENGISVKVFLADGRKCERCWRITKDTEDGICSRCRKVESKAEL